MCRYFSSLSSLIWMIIMVRWEYWDIKEADHFPQMVIVYPMMCDDFSLNGTLTSWYVGNEWSAQLKFWPYQLAQCKNIEGIFKNEVDRSRKYKNTHRGIACHRHTQTTRMTDIYTNWNNMSHTLWRQTFTLTVKTNHTSMHIHARIKAC